MTARIKNVERSAKRHIPLWGDPVTRQGIGNANRPGKYRDGCRPTHLNRGVLVHKATPGSWLLCVTLKLGDDDTDGHVMMGLRSEKLALPTRQA
mgnify:CR=1 FL=1